MYLVETTEIGVNELKHFHMYYQPVYKSGCPDTSRIFIIVVGSVCRNHNLVF